MVKLFVINYRVFVVVNSVYSTPPYHTSAGFAELRLNSCDSSGTKKAKRHIQEFDCLTTPLAKNSSTITSLVKGKENSCFEVFTPRKNKNAVYRWKVEVLEGDEVVAKRLIGKSASVKKRLSSYMSAIRKGNSLFAKLILKSLNHTFRAKCLSVSFGVIHSNIPPELLGRVEKILINVHKADNPAHVLNQRAGGGGASERKPLSATDISVVHDVASAILVQKQTPAKAGSFGIRGSRVYAKLKAGSCLKRGVVYSIENIKTRMLYVGKTEVRLSERFSGHTSAINTGNRAKKIHHAIKQNPRDFVIRILYEAPAKQRHILEEIEHAYIVALGSHKKGIGYNDNKGTTLIHKMAKEVQDPHLLEQIKKVQSVFKKLTK